jgi:hypothetical protein
VAEHAPRLAVFGIVSDCRKYLPLHAALSQLQPHYFSGITSFLEYSVISSRLHEMITLSCAWPYRTFPTCVHHAFKEHSPSLMVLDNLWSQSYIIQLSILSLS